MYNSQLDTFIRVAELGSFRKAAESLYISTPAVMQQINALEEKYGFKLFDRTHQGVCLTEGGSSLYKDAKTIIRECNIALENAKRKAGLYDTTIRIGTSLLHKWRILSKLFAKFYEEKNKFKIEFPSTPGQLTKANDFEDLGKDYDILEGMYCTSWEGLCNFRELTMLPFAVGIPRNHPLANKTEISLSDLDGETFVTVPVNISDEYDQIRFDIMKHCKNVTFIDSPYYAHDTFASCEINSHILITIGIYADIHPNLVTVPFKPEYKYLVKYGIIYPIHPSILIKEFVDEIQRLYNENCIE